MDLRKFLVTAALIFLFSGRAAAEGVDLEFTLDVSSSTIPLPQIFTPSLDLGGRGFHSEMTWPQAMAGREAIERWARDIGFKGIYRIQYSLWEISQLGKNRQLQEKLLANYEAVIKSISDSGHAVILDIFSTPQGLGKVLDNKSSPADLKIFKALVKTYIRALSCEKKYNIWYEVWTAPDLDMFFLGRQQEYLSLYRAVAESVKELEAEYKMHIPVGGPSSSWWFRGSDSSAIYPERSLIYELIKFCYHYKLPLDFVSWHAYSTDPRTEKEMTVYNKTSVALMRDWLSYFNFPKDTPFIVDEWNYDSGQNILAERKDKSYIAASFIPARLRHMYEADINYQVFFSLEDFQDNKEGVARNVGVFWYGDGESGSGGNKAIYNGFRLLSMLGPNMYISPSKINDEFVGLIATRSDSEIAILIYNYIDPDILRSALSRNVATLREGERRSLLEVFGSDLMEKLKRKELDVNSLRVPARVKGLLKRSTELQELAQKSAETPRVLKLGVKNLKNEYLYSRYRVDSTCSLNCEFAPAEEKTVSFVDGLYSENITLDPYSLNLIILKPKPEEAKAAPVAELPEGAQKEKAAVEGAAEKSPAQQAGEAANVTAGK